MQNIEDLNGHEMVEGAEAFVLDVAFAGIASGVEGYLGVLTNNTTLLSVPFSVEEKAASSTMRELLVLHKYYVNNNLDYLRGLEIVHFYDNKRVAASMAKGSGKVYLHNLAREIYI